MEVIIHPHCLWMFGVVDRLTLKVIPACEPARGSDLKQHADTRPLYTIFAHHRCRAVHYTALNVNAFKVKCNNVGAG